MLHTQKKKNLTKNRFLINQILQNLCAYTNLGKHLQHKKGKYLHLGKRKTHKISKKGKFTENFIEYYGLCYII